MTTALLDAPAAGPSPERHPSTRVPAWLREPLLHFVLLGGALFLVDHRLRANLEDPRTIVVGPEVDAQARQTFAAARGHDPSPDELRALRQVWLDNEVLYREGLALQVDKGDPAIRERVIFKALSVVDGNVKIPAITDEELRRWFEGHRSKYDEPARYDFEEAVLSGDDSEAAVRKFVAELNDGAPGDVRAGLRVFKARPEASLAPSYGEGFAQALAAAKQGTWSALPTSAGWRAIRPGNIAPPVPANFEALRGVVLQDWKDAVASEQRTEAVRGLAKKYRVIQATPTAEGR